MQNKSLSLNRKKAAVLILTAACLLGFFNSLGNGFIIDDYHTIVNNDHIKQVNNFPAIFFSSYLNYYRPLVSLSLAVDYHFWQLNPFGYHLSNLIIHFLNCLMLFFLAEILFADYSFSLLCAVFFAIHPLNSVTVNYISDRSNLLVGFFMFSALICFCLAYKKRKIAYYLYASVLFLLSLFCRENSVLLPFYLLCIIFAIGKKQDWKLLGLVFLATVCINGAYLVIRPDVFSYASNTQGLFVLQDINSFIYIIVKYISLTLFPFNISFFRSIPLLNSAQQIILYLIFIMIICLVFFWRRKRIFLFCVFWFLVGLIPLYKTMFSREGIPYVMQDSWIYFSSFGLFGVVAAVLLHLKSKARVWLYYVLIGTIILFLLVQSLINNSLWKDTPTYCQYWLKMLPGNSVALSNMAGHYFRNKDYSKALYYLNRYREEVNPEFVEEEIKIAILNRIGLCYFEMGDFDNAIQNFEAAISVDSPASKDDVYFAMGKAYLSKNNPEKALGCFRMSLKEAIQSIHALKKNSFLFGNEDLISQPAQDANMQGAKKTSVKIMKIKSSHDLSRTLLNLKFLGRFFYEKQLFLDAAACFEAVVNAFPLNENSDACFNLGLIYAKLNDMDKAILNFKKASFSPEYFLEATYSLSILYAKTGQKKNSLEAMKAVIRQDPGYYNRRAKSG